MEEQSRYSGIRQEWKWRKELFEIVIFANNSLFCLLFRRIKLSWEISLEQQLFFNNSKQKNVEQSPICYIVSQIGISKSSQILSLLRPALSLQKLQIMSYLKSEAKMEHSPHFQIRWRAIILLCYQNLSIQADQYSNKSIIKNILSKMDLQWLLPEQIEQILRFCELSAVEDLSLAANILQGHNWNIENALNDVVTQSDEAAKQEQPTPKKSGQIASFKQELKQQAQHNPKHQAAQFSVKPALHQPCGQKSSAQNEHRLLTSILQQQNWEYEQMGRKMKEKQAEEAQLKDYSKLREQEFAQGQLWFKNRKVQPNFPIKFRLPQATLQHKFAKTDSIETVVKYVSCCLRDSFEDRYAEFQLVQSHPPKSLIDRKEETLEEVFEDSLGEVLIVRELD